MQLELVLWRGLLLQRAQAPRQGWVPGWGWVPRPRDEGMSPTQCGPGVHCSCPLHHVQHTPILMLLMLLMDVQSSDWCK
jgi:hypothetical protein